MAAFRAGGDSLYQATLKQGLLSDPLDKMITSFVVFFIVGSLSSRFVARFPNGEKAMLAGTGTGAGAELGVESGS